MTICLNGLNSIIEAIYSKDQLAVTDNEGVIIDPSKIIYLNKFIVITKKFPEKLFNSLVSNNIIKSRIKQDYRMTRRVIPYRTDRVNNIKLKSITCNLINEPIIIGSMKNPIIVGRDKMTLYDLMKWRKLI